MALLKISYKSAELGTKTGINVILPEKRLKDEPLPVLYLLHGYTDNETSWCSQTSLERYVRYKNIAVVMPNAFNSFYTDMACGVYNFYTYFICELIPFCRENFNVSPRREDNFIAGLSMGGYGAFKIAFLNPKAFCTAASFSGCMDIKRLAAENDMTAVFGNRVSDREDLFYLAKITSKEPVKPRLYQWCGTEDYLYQDNLSFKNYIEPLGFEYTYRQSNGAHEWKYWDDQIRKIFAWFGIKNNERIE